MASGNISLVEKDELGDVDFNEDMTEPLREPPPMPWLLLWSLHYYILGIVYFCLMCYALYSIAQHFRRTTGPKKVSNIQSCIFAIKLLLVIFGFSRALYMYLYLHFWYAKTPPWKITRNILANLGFPCLTGGFGLMCLILYEASRLKARSSSKVLHNKWIMISIIVFHFVAVIFAVTAIELLDSYVLMLLICHGFFVVWGLLLIVTFVVFATTLSKAERKSSGVLAEMKEKESVSYGGVSVTSTYQNFSNQSTPKTEKSDRFTPARDQNVLDDVDGGSVTSNDGNETPRCGENPTGMGTTDHKLEGRHGFEGGAKDGTNGVGRAGGDGQGSVREGRNNGKVSYVTDGPSYNSTSPSADTEGAGGSRFVRFRSMMFDRFSTKKLVPNKSRMAFRAKLTRKVMRIAKVTANFKHCVCGP